jgi:hypothetical protein
VRYLSNLPAKETVYCYLTGLKPCPVINTKLIMTVRTKRIQCVANDPSLRKVCGRSEGSLYISALPFQKGWKETLGVFLDHKVSTFIG